MASPFTNAQTNARRPRVTRGLRVGATLVGLVLTSLPAVTRPPAASAAPSTPNFVVVVTDDQRWDTIGRCLNGFDGLDLTAGADACMPALQQRLMANGTTFLGGYVPTSLCCPSRASLLSGQYARHTGVMNNSGPTSIPAFRDGSTLATWLDAAGYRTGLFGKYMNGYGEPGTLPSNYVPPGWDAWYGVSGDQSRYTTYNLVQKDPGGPATTVSYAGTNNAPIPCAAGVVYLTDHLCRRALDFLAADTTTPFFLYFSPFSPHEPFTAASRHLGVFDGVATPTYPNLNAAPSPSPPRWMPTAPLPAATIAQIRTGFRNSLVANRAVDDAVEQLWTRLASDGRLDETVWIFLSDNGVAQGEHRYVGKPCEYEECHRVPFVVACPPGVCPGGPGAAVDAQHLVLNIDIAPTIAELAGVAPQHRVDGTSLVPLLGGVQPPTWRTSFPIEDQGTGTIVHAPLGVVSREADGHLYKLVSFQLKPGFELYDLTADPWELTNLYGNPAFASIRASLTARMTDIETPPTMTLAGPTGDVTAGDVVYTWTASQTAEVECRVDGSPFTPCGSGTSGAITLTDLTLAPHTFDLRGFDADNNPSATLFRTFTVKADPTPETPALEVATAGGGTGTVISTPAGIACPSECSEAFARGTTVTLAATPSGGSTFTGWSGDCTGTGPCLLTMDVPHTVTASFAPPSVTEVYPSTVTVLVGGLLGGAASNLSADDDAVLLVGSTTGKGTRTAAWYGAFTGVSNGASTLAAAYTGSASLTCTQTIAMWRWTDSTWIQLDSRSVGATDVQVANLTPPGTLADFVSGTTGDGEVRVRVSCSTGAGTFSLSGDLMKLTL